MRVGGLNQELTYWHPTGEDRYGVRTFAPPELIMGRWEDKSEQVRLQGGDTIVSRAVVLVDREVSIEGFLCRGDARAIMDPGIAFGAEEIKDFASATDLRNVSSVNRAVL